MPIRTSVCCQFGWGHRGRVWVSSWGRLVGSSGVSCAALVAVPDTDKCLILAGGYHYALIVAPAFSLISKTCSDVIPDMLSSARRFPSDGSRRVLSAGIGNSQIGVDLALVIEQHVRIGRRFQIPRPKVPESVHLVEAHVNWVDFP